MIFRDLGVQGQAYLVMNLRDLDRVTGRTLPINHGKRGRAVSWMRNVVHVIGTVEVLAVPAAVAMSIHICQKRKGVSLHWEDDA